MDINIKTTLGIKPRCKPKELPVITRGASFSLTYKLDINYDIVSQVTFTFKQKQKLFYYNMFHYLTLTRDTEIEELKKTISNFEEGNSNNDVLQEELNTTKKELHIANETLNEYASKCTRYDEVIKSLNEKNEDLDVLATSRLADIKKREEDIVNLNNTIEQMNTEFANITIKYNDTITDKNELAKSKEAITKSYKELQDTYNKLVEENTNKVQFLNNVIEQLKEDIEDKDDRLVDDLDKVSELQKQLETESGKVEEVKTKTEAAVTSIKKKLQTLNDGLGDEFNIFG